MPIRRRRTTTALKRPIPLCEKCGYATVFAPSRLMNMFKAPKVDVSSTLPGEVTPRDASVISEWLPQARRDLALYTRELNRLRSRLVRLEGMRDDLQERIDRHASLVAPVARLPTEVLQVILHLSCIPDDSEGPHHRERGVSLMYPAGRTALRLALVCSRWRSVALDIPELWSYINVSIFSHRELGPILMLPEDRGKLQGSKELAQCMEAHPVQNVVELYLERSQAHPLDIILYCPSEFESAPERVVELSPTEIVCNHFLLEVYKIFCAHSHRWRTGHINIAHGPQALPREDVYGRWHDEDEIDEVANGYYDSKELSIPLLEVLDIYPGPATIKLSKAPRLHTLRVTATPEWCRFPIEKEILKAPALRSLTLRRYDASDLQSILSKLAVHSRVDFVFELPHKDRGYAFYDNQIREYPAPAVKSILVDFSVARSLDSLDELLKSLTAPNATKMEFVLGQRQQATKFPHNLLLGMIKRSAMPLTILKIDGFYMPNKALVKILKLLPTIEVLELGEGSISELRRTVRKYLDKHGSQVKEAKSEGSQWRDLIRGSTYVEETFICSKLIRELTLASFLNDSQSVTPLLPNLTSLKLTFRPTRGSQDLKNMVYSRRRDLDLSASNTVQSGSSPEAVRLNSTRSTGGLMSLKLVLIMDTLILDNRERTMFREFGDVIQELKEEGLDAQMKGLKYH